MTKINITRVPANIKDIDDGRKASYVAGNASPAVWYWLCKRGDKDAVKENMSAKNISRLAGFRLNHGNVEAICLVGECWYPVKIS